MPRSSAAGYFTRATGKPVVVKETFSAPDATAHYNLIVFNGEKGKNRVSSATIKINGIEILRESDFNQQVDRIERSVSLLLSNSISVELKSAPGSFITIAIECIDCLVITNHPPVAQDQSMTTDEDVPKAITLIAMDPDDDPVTYQIVAQPAHGTLSGAPPSLTYTPIAHYFGSDSFAFKANDGKLDSNIAAVSIIVTHVNHPPVAQNQCVYTDEDTAKSITLSVTDVDGDPLTYTIVTQPGHGTLSGTPPNVAYTPAAHYFGRDSFTFKANDDNADSNVATVSVSVTPVIGINVIITVAGNGEVSYGGDGGLAIKARLLSPSGVAVDTLGNLYIAEYQNDRIRKVDTNGIITTVAGNGMEGYSGDGGPANKAQLALPQGVTVDASGNLCIADTDNNRIRKVVGLSKGATIIGKITDSSTHMPLSEVTVVIKDSLNTFQTKTDLNGICIVSGMIPGSFTARFGMPGYIEQTVNGTLVSGQTKTLDIQLTLIPPLILTITSPPDGAVLSSSPITVIGNVSNDANVTVNSIQGSVINNTFSVSIPLSNGLNIITVTASDQYGQTASQSLSVILSTGGVIVGTVTDSSTGLSLPAATVSVTDIVGARAALTDSEGGYIVYNVSPGAFSGSIRKDGYGTYNFSGTVAFEQIVTINAALAPILPVISDIAVSEITANSAAISWATNQLSDSLVEYGTTTFYGSSIGDSTLTTAHAAILNNLMPATLIISE